MERHYFFVVYAALIGITCAQNGRPLEVKFSQSETKYARIGDQLDIICEINRPLDFVINNSLEYILKSADEEVSIAEGNSPGFGSNSTYYFTNITRVPENGIHFNLYILKVTDRFDATLICRAKEHKDSGSQTEKEDSLDIVVFRPVETLHLKFNDNEPISEDFNEPVQVDIGNQSVACNASGSNPAAIVQLHLNGIEVQNVEIKTEKMETKLTKFRTTLTAFVTISDLNSTQELQCIAKSKFGDERNVKLPIKIKIYDPEIHCENFTAYEGQKNIVLSCTVDYSDLDIIGFYYSIGENSNEWIHNNEFIEVSREKLSDTKVRVHLNLTEANDWHFKTQFYINAKHRNGQETRMSVRLYKTSGKSASWHVSLSATVLMMTIALWWLVIY